MDSRHYQVVNAVLTEIEAEREHQNYKWGGREVDDAHSFADWMKIIDAIQTSAEGIGDVDYKGKRRKLAKIAGVAIAAMEAMYRTGKTH